MWNCDVDIKVMRDRRLYKNLCQLGSFSEIVKIQFLRRFVTISNGDVYVSSVQHQPVAPVWQSCSCQANTQQQLLTQCAVISLLCWCCIRSISNGDDGGWCKKSKLNGCMTLGYFWFKPYKIGVFWWWWILLCCDKLTVPKSRKCCVEAGLLSDYQGLATFIWTLENTPGGRTGEEEEEGILLYWRVHLVCG